MAGLDAAIKILLKYMCFLLPDGPIKSGHDKSEFDRLRTISRTML